MQQERRLTIEFMVMVMVMMVTELERAMRTASLWQFRSNLPKNKNVPMVEVKRNWYFYQLKRVDRIRQLPPYSKEREMFQRPVVGWEGDDTATSWTEREDHLMRKFGWDVQSEAWKPIYIFFTKTNKFRPLNLFESRIKEQLGLWVFFLLKALVVKKTCSYS